MDEKKKEMGKTILIWLPALLLIPFASAAVSVGSPAISDPIDLSAGSASMVQCNAAISDDSGWENILSANATIWHSSSSEGAADDDNDHYTNASCSFGENISSTEVPVTCSFSMQYFSNPGSWTCKIRAYNGSSEGSSLIAYSVNTLLAIKIPENLNFGSMALGQTSTDDSENVTAIENYGNVQLDVKLSGSAMACSSGSFSTSSIRYSGSDNAAYDSMESLSGNSTTFDLNLPQRTGGASVKNMYWKIRLPEAGAGGMCSNTIDFTAASG